MNYLLDTNVISELVAIHPDPPVAKWVESVDPESIYLSVITIGELNKGIEKLPDSRRKTALEVWLVNDLLVRFRDRIITLDISIMMTWGKLVARLEAIGLPMPAIDSLIAATAAQSGFTLTTRNTRDFQPTGIKLYNPWEFQD